MTYGEIRFRLTKAFPGVDPDLIDGWINDVYTEILDRIPWKRLEGETVIAAPASYATGTVGVTQNSSLVTGAGTAWTNALNGRMFRPTGCPEYYFFTCVDGVNGTIDRPFESVTNPAASYRLDQSVFLLPPEVRVLRSVRPLHVDGRLTRLSQTELNARAPNRAEYGTPTTWSPTWDSFTDPPQQQFELYPVVSTPDANGALLSFAVTYIYDAGQFDPSATSTSILPWMRPAPLIEGVSAKIKRHLKDYDGAREHAAEAERLVLTMFNIDNQQRGTTQMQLDEDFRTRKVRWARHSRHHEGWPA